VGLSPVLKLRGGTFAGLKIKRWDFRRSYKSLKNAVVLRPDWQNFFTVWAGYDESSNSWEPYKALMHVDKLHDYQREHRMRALIPREHK
jgi:hypothetical protein